MKEELIEEKLMGYLDSLEGIVEKGVEQTPLVVEEILSYAIIQSAALGVVCLVLTIILFFFSHRLFKLAQEDGEEFWVVWFFATVIPGVPCLISLAHNLSILLKATIAPGLYILEYVRSFA